MASVAVRLLAPEEAARRWGEIEPLLAMATRLQGCYEPVDLLTEALIGRMGIWVAGEGHRLLAAMVTQVKAYPRKRVVDVLFVGGGEMWKWIREFVRLLDQHREEHGCAHIVAWGRKGWARFGFREGGVVLVRD